MSTVSERPWQDAETLRRLLTYEQVEQQEAAEMLDCSEASINRWKNKHGIKAPHKDAQTLEYLYITKKKSTEYIANCFGITRATLNYWMRKHGIHSKPRYPWHDKEQVNKDYHEDGMSIRQIASKYNISGHSVRYWLDKLDIETRKSSRDKPPCVYHDTRGYVFCSSAGDKFPIHRLAAVAWFGLDAVVDKEIHHKNGIKWFNTEDNLEPLTSSEHSKVHFEQGDMTGLNARHNGEL